MRELEERDCELLMTGCWAVWEARNKCVFEGARPSVPDVLKRVRDLVGEMREMETEVLGHVEGRQETRGWRKPRQGWSKINVDAGWREGVGLGFGVVCRDDEGRVKWGVTIQKREEREIQALEAEAVLVGLQEARREDLTKVVIESDCLTVIEDVKRKKQGRSDIFLIYDEIHNLCSHFVSVEFSFAKRLSNRVAHELAHVWPWQVGRRIWDGVLPRSVEVAVVFDSDNMI
ncbi:uncharacterized protein LOC141651016 [Silene latifolia]|uniref:uncharacterized protein LOC141651016 n=1 Tax=Silene latifolia TaxID=37657 RepID=UPI003D787975